MKSYDGAKETPPFKKGKLMIGKEERFEDTKGPSYESL
jgi:hypothetical protein